MLVIKIPKLPWPRILFLSALAALLAYWFFAIRPYLWISNARVEMVSLSIRPDLSGRIAQIGPDAGEGIQKGQLLFAFDTSLLHTHQHQLRSQLNSLNSQLHAEQLRMDKAMQQYLETPHQELFATFEEAQTKSEALSSELASLQTELDSLEIQMQKLAMRAPFDGLVLDRAVHENSVVSFGEPLYTIGDPSRLWIEAQVPEKLLSRLTIGAPIRIQLVAFPKKEWQGKLSWIGPAAHASMIPIKVSIEDPTFPPRPGLSAKIALR